MKRESSQVPYLRDCGLFYVCSIIKIYGYYIVTLSKSIKDNGYGENK
jgi:hypothetical protein